MKDLDPINYILMDVMNTIDVNNIKVQNNAAMFNGYYLDITRPKKNLYRLTVRTNYLSTLCTVIFNKSSYAIRYNSSFVWEYKKNMFSTNVYPESFGVDGLINVLEGLKTEMDFDIDLFISVLLKCTELFETIEYA